jgi:hypothetical protein
MHLIPSSNNGVGHTFQGISYAVSLAMAQVTTNKIASYPKFSDLIDKRRREGGEVLLQNDFHLICYRLAYNHGITS